MEVRGGSACFRSQLTSSAVGERETAAEQFHLSAFKEEGNHFRFWSYLWPFQIDLACVTTLVITASIELSPRTAIGFSYLIEIDPFHRNTLFSTKHFTDRFTPSLLPRFRDTAVSQTGKAASIVERRSS